MDRAGHDRRVLVRFKPGDQTQLAFGSARLVPREPDAVGRAEVAGAEVLFQLFSAIHELLFGGGVARRAIGVVEGENGQHAIDENELFVLPLLFLFVVVEHDAPGEAADGRLAWLGEHLVGPEGDDAGGCLRLRFGVPEAQVVMHLPRRAADEATSGQQGRQRKSPRSWQVTAHQLLQRRSSGPAGPAIGRCAGS